MAWYKIVLATALCSQALSGAVMDDQSAGVQPQDYHYEYYDPPQGGNPDAPPQDFKGYPTFNDEPADVHVPQDFSNPHHHHADGQHYREPSVQAWYEGEEHVYFERNYNYGNHHHHQSSYHDYGGYFSYYSNSRPLTVEETKGYSFVALFGVLTALGCSEYMQHNKLKKLNNYKKSCVEYIPSKPGCSEKVPTSGTQNIFVSGKVKTTAGVSDAEFGVVTQHPWLKRKIEVYQWRENIEQQGEINKITYKSEWSSTPISSANFKNQNYRNTAPRLREQTFVSSDSKIGECKIDMTALAQQLKTLDYKPAGEKYIYSKGCNRSQPTIGDTRCSYTVMDCFATNLNCSLSILGHGSPSGVQAEYALVGDRDLKQFIKDLRKQNKGARNLCRLVGFVGTSVLGVWLAFLSSQ